MNHNYTAGIMTIEELTELYLLISQGSENISDNKQSIELRKQAFSNIMGENLVKLAFDTRRVDQETQYIARRGLQNYSRSEQFISLANIEKLKCFTKLKGVLDGLKSEFERQPAWQDSYCRVLLDSLNRGLRTEQKDGDITDNQPGVGSLDYLEEMIFVRYRLTCENIETMDNEQLKKVLLSKDLELSDPDVAQFMPKKQNAKMQIITEKEATEYVEPIRKFTKADVGNQTYDNLIGQLFEGLKTSANQKETEKTITITINSKFGA
jgi:hypothetical protein